MHWKWDPNKDRINQQKHLVSFDTAILTLNDPLSVTDDDPYPWEPSSLSEKQCSKRISSVKQIICCIMTIMMDILVRD